MPWRGPNRPGELPTLGWVALDWFEAYLPAPNEEFKPFVCTNEQAQLILHWFTLDTTGKFVFRRGASRRAKGWGKSPLEAAKALFEFAGPCRFGGWDAEGEPVGIPWGIGDADPAWVQIAAVSEDQTENTYGALYSQLTARNGMIAADLGIDQGRTRLYLKHRRGAKLEPVTASAGSREGQRITYAVLDETHLWNSRNGGKKLAGTLRRNASKMGGRTYETTNAFVPGEGSVAEATHNAAQGGRSGVFYDAIEAPDVEQDDPDEVMIAALEVAYGDAAWVDLPRVLADIRDPASDWADSQRFFFNRNVKGEAAAVDPKLWDSLAFPREVPKGTPVGLGFDGSISDDCTVLRGCTAEGYSFLIHAQGPKVVINRTAVHEAVAQAFDYYRVGLMLCDPAKWWTEIEGWAERYGAERVLAFDTNSDKRMSAAVDRWLTGLREGTHTHDGDPLTDSHVKAAHKRKARASAPDDDSRTLYTLTKGEDHRKIDAAVADVLAYQAAMTMSAPALQPWVLV